MVKSFVLIFTKLFNNGEHLLLAETWPTTTQFETFDLLPDIIFSTTAFFSSEAEEFQPIGRDNSMRRKSIVATSVVVKYHS